MGGERERTRERERKRQIMCTTMMTKYCTSDGDVYDERFYAVDDCNSCVVCVMKPRPHRRPFGNKLAYCKRAAVNILVGAWW